MASVVNETSLFTSLIPLEGRSKAKVLTYDTSQIIDLENVPLNGGFLVKILDVSMDPYMKTRMLGEGVNPFFPMYEFGKPLYGNAVGVVIRSEHKDVSVNDHLYGVLTYQSYVIKDTMEGLTKISKGPAESNVPWSAFVGVLGAVGQTAYMGWKEYSHSKKGETLFVSAGAGSIGSFVIQLAKADGLKVIASAGSDEKVRYMKSLGADVAFNYKTTSTREVLQKEGPIDIYWDNVGGETLDIALEASNLYARFIECGMISAVAQQKESPIRNLVHVIAKNLTFNGFIVDRLILKYQDQFYAEVLPKVASGEIKYSEHVLQGFAEMEEGLYYYGEGVNIGKVVVHVADD